MIDCRAGSGKVKDKPETDSCLESKNMLQKIVSEEHRNQLEKAPIENLRHFEIKDKKLK